MDNNHHCFTYCVYCYRIVEIFHGTKFLNFSENQAFRGFNFAICVWIVRFVFRHFAFLERGMAAFV